MLGGAASRLSCEICDPERENGPSVDVVVGAYATPRLRVGVQGGAWTHDDDEVRESVYRGGVVAHLHPKATSGFFVLAGEREQPDLEEFGGQPTGEVGVDLSLDAARRVTLRAGFSVGERRGIAIGAMVQGARRPRG
jgi:hypothetical protein